MSLELILGCMYSGKSSELYSILKRYAMREKKCLYVTYIDDIRYFKLNSLKSSVDSFSIVSHENLITKSRETLTSDTFIDLISCKNVADIFDSIQKRKYDVIAFDESQFYLDIVDHVKLLLKSGIKIYCGGLDSNAKQKPFEIISNLIAISDNYKKLFAICNVCKDHDAIFTLKKQKEDKSDSLVEIGGTERYYVICRKCFNKQI